MNFNRFSRPGGRTANGLPGLLLLTLLMATGCAKLESLPLHREMGPLPDGPLCRVAVLPFQNDSDYPLGGALVSKVFATQLQQSRDYFLIQEGDVHKVLQQLRLLPGEQPGLEQYRIMADRVDAQLLVSGTVMQMLEGRGPHNTADPKIVMEVQLRDSHNGEVLWTAFHRRTGSEYTKTMHFGSINTMTGLSRIMAEEILTLWQDKGLAPCNVSP